MFSITERAKITGRCVTTAICSRRSRRLSSRTSTPSIDTRPACGSSNRGSSFTSVDLPLPFGPTIARHSPGFTSSDTSASAGGSCVGHVAERDVLEAHRARLGAHAGPSHSGARLLLGLVEELPDARRRRPGPLHHVVDVRHLADRVEQRRQQRHHGHEVRRGDLAVKRPRRQPHDARARDQNPDHLDQRRAQRLDPRQPEHLLEHPAFDAPHPPALIALSCRSP